jgi:hypothetical protein
MSADNYSSFFQLDFHIHHKKKLWSLKHPDFQRCTAEAGQGHFDISAKTIILKYGLYCDDLLSQQVSFYSFKHQDLGPLKQYSFLNTFSLRLSF